MTHILIVDDTLANGRLAQTVLQKAGYIVTMVDNAEDALKFLAENHKQIDLVVSDIHMPQIDGFEFLKLLKSDTKYAQIPFAFLTLSMWSMEVKKQGLELGADAFIFRPMEARALVTEVESVLPEEKRVRSVQS